MIDLSNQLNIELRHLKSFLAVSKCMNFRKAADELHIAQPALSRQIAQLETQLDCPLFDRSKRQIQLTAAGDYLLKALPDFFQQLHHITHTTTSVARGKIQQLRFGYSSAAMSGFLPSIIRYLHNSMEDCEFSFDENTSDELINGVIKKQYDAAFILHRPDNVLLRTLPIKSDKTGVVLPTDHPLTRKKTVSFKDLRDETLITFPRKTNPQMYDEIISHCHEAGFSPKHLIETAPRSTAIALVAAGQGIATLAASLQHSCISGTVYKPLRAPTPMVNYSCITLKQRQGEWLDLLESFIAKKLKA